MNINKTNVLRISIIISFAIIYSLISLVNHYTFRTFAWDLGIYNQALFDYAHFRFDFNTVIQPSCGNLLSDHFELLMIIFSPLYYLFGSYTLLIIQIVAILFGGEGIYKYIELISNSKKLALAAMVQFFLFYGIYSALAFDYHNNVVGAMFVPWIFYFIIKENWGKTIFFFFLLLISKENMALWGFFIFMGMMIMFRKNKKKLVFTSILCFTSLLYFLIVVKWVIPSIALPGNDYLHFRYAALGKNISEALSTIITKPIYSFKLLFINSLNIPEGNYLKAELHLSILLSGGILLFYRPYYLLMLLPIYGQKLYCDLPMYWGLSSHYSIEFIPILTIGAFNIIYSINKQKIKKIITLLLIFFTAVVSAWTFSYKTFTCFNKENQRFYKKNHYKRNFDLNKAYTALNFIPKNADICAQNEFVSHLAFRKMINIFPFVDTSSYIFLSQDYASSYPISKELHDQYMFEFIMNKDWSIIYNDYPFLLFKKNKTNELKNLTKTISEKIETYLCNADSISPDNKFFYSNNKDQHFNNIGTRSNEKVFSGKYSVKLTADKQYGLSTTLKNIKKESFFEVTVWMYSGDKNCSIVASGNTADSYYSSGNTPTGKEQNGWKQIKMNIYITHDLPNGELNIYLFNGGKCVVYFDDLSIKHHLLYNF